MDKANLELFKQTLEKGLLRRIEKEIGIEPYEPYEPSENMKRFEQALKNYDVGPNGAILLPGFPEKCEGNGEHPNYECCCDECNYLQICLKN